MLIYDDVYKNAKFLRGNKEPFFVDGLAAWNQEKERKRMRQLQEQKEIQNLLEKYWPWSKPTKSRGIGNLRLEEIFPDDEMRKSKRMVGLLNLGKPGGGAPNATELGKKLIRTREDPILRFQWGKDLRQAVDNTMRYRKNKRDQDEYKKQLDKIVGEKKMLREKERTENLEQDRATMMKTPPWGRPGPGGAAWRPPKDIGLNFLRSMGWSDVHTLDKLENDHETYKAKINKELAHFKRINHPQKRSDRENDKNFVNIKPYKLSPLPGSKGRGGDLVNVIARKRYDPMIPLSTTDVTKDKRDEVFYSRRRNDSNELLQGLDKQMRYKNQKRKHAREEDTIAIRRHFATLDSFWGRPGHGARRSATKKGNIEHMLFPQIMPIGVA